MPIPFTCPHCHTSMELDDHYGGQSGPCRSCGATITIPDPIPDTLRSRKTSRAIDLPLLYGLALVGSAMTFIVLVLLVIGWFSRVAPAPVAIVAGGPVTFAGSPNSIAGRELEDIYTALEAYEKEHGTLPPAYTVDADGAPLHSWRVLLLPYLGHQELYNQLKLDEPWNSPYNRAFLQQPAPSAFVSRSDLASTGEFANFLAVVDDASLMHPGTGQAMPDLKATPEAAPRILLVEAINSNVPWGKPEDLGLRAFIDAYSQSLGPMHVLRADGRTEAIPISILSDEELEQRVVGSK